ncbi:MAG: hypothetical protein OEV48_18440 [Acidobacteriota bacterium]|nr:hypothetical protein [Acidobacteriota bacterium]
MWRSMIDGYERLGDRDAALDWIKRSLQPGYPLQIIEDYPGFVALVEDPRFQALLEEYGVE